MAADPSRARAESDAAASLCTRHYDRIYGYCLYKLGSRDEAEDAAQTTFLHAVRGLQRGVVPVVELNWLLTIARNVCLARYRTRGRRGRLEVLSDPQALAEAAARPDQGDSRVGLEQALARIPEQQRRAILLREWRGLSYREIAAELGVTVPAVETLIFRARRSLAAILADETPQRRGGLFAVLDLGGLAATLKSALGGASAAKVAAGVAAVGAALVAGPALVPERDGPPAAVSAALPDQGVDASAYGAPRRAFDHPVARPLAAREAAPSRRTARRERAAERKREGRAGPPARAEAAAPAGPDAGPGGPSAETLVGTATATVATAVGATSQAVEVVAGTGIGLPAVEDVAGDVTGEVADVVGGPSSALP
ncbi:MAG TPA: RNA polymerase sigma factor [Gaiellaceae bacterium]|nr:RNA polymerase sigma factor [Gaiellaceae bacterium]